MSSTPRKSSIASRRAPASLRLPSASRKASNPHLSLIFAQGGSVPQNGNGESSKSEAALSRQLDGDLGGQRMGLRSRRSSSATVHTMRTTSAVSLLEEGMQSPVLQEDPEEEGYLPTAGPSRTPMRINGGGVSPLAGEGDGGTPTTRGGTGGNSAFINPKTSSAWLRWNPPPPTFPKTSIGKGKGKEIIANGGESMKSFATEKARANSSEATSKPPDTLPSAPIVKEPSDKANGEPIGSLAPPITEEPPGLSTPKRSWWNRSPLPASPKPPPPAPIPQPPPTTVGASPLQASTYPTSAPPPSNTLPTPTISEQRAATSPNDPPVAPADPAAASDENATTNGWFSYLSWGRSMPNPTQAAPPPPPIPGNVKTASAPTSNEAAAEPVEPTVDQSAPAPPEDSSPAGGPPPVDNTSLGVPPPQPNVTSAPAGWGTYLYSFVSSNPSTPPVVTTPPIAPVISVPATEPAPPPVPPVGSKPTAAPPVIPPPSPLPAPVPAAVLPNETASSTPQPDSTPVLGDSPTLAPAVGSLRKASVTSTSGWLSYLAFRAGQKKITGSTIASSHGSPRPSGEHGREEVMDFSQDPEFPGSTPAKDRSMPPPPLPSAAKGASKAVGMESRGKRLSISSTRSAKTPLSSSPAQAAKMDAKASSRPPSIKQTPASSLPAPPQPPSSQPNLVIPTFSTTFDRPPRSLPPLPPADASAGIAAATSGLAWKALSAAGTYVYPHSKSAPPTPGAAPKETRGMKEGRSVGGELPRRLELGGAPDDGWKGVKRVVVVGVHGWFPAKMLNSVIGEPTGTSTKFATMMGAAVTKFFEEKGLLDHQFRLTLMPLEGEGTIDHRVDKLYKSYLSNPAWINELRRADAIFFAAHSQGCIVTAHLLWRMITQGHIRTPLNREAVSRCEWAFGPIGLLPPEEPRRGRKPGPHPTQDRIRETQKVAMLAMCGVHLGPLYSISTSTVIQPYLQWFENAAARELFEFQESTSAVSVAYQKALSMILENDVRVVLLASLNDQVVPIYGASFSTATHPLLLRALFVDGASYSASDFMTNLLCFAFMLRNAGIDDQRLVEHLSEATAGSLTGLGHSSPYEEAACYDLVVNYLFLSGGARKPHERLSIEPFSVRDTRNDFELPWIMRALVDSPEVKDLFPEELRELKEGIVAWKPNTKALKEIKRRLEPMAGRQSKLRPLANSPSSTSLNSQHNGKVAGNGRKAGSGLGKDW